MELIKGIGQGIVPFIVGTIALFALLRDVPVFDVFIEGAAEGLKIAVRIIPPLVGLMVVISMVRNSGMVDIISWILSPVTHILHIPNEMLPLALLRPLSGSGALSVVSDIFSASGVDSFVGKCASVMMGSTETTFYTIAVYFGYKNITKTGNTLPCALFADFLGVVMSVFFVRLLL